MKNIIFIHGLESSGQGFKGRLFQKVLPGCLTPDFEGYKPKFSIKTLLKKRMKQLYKLLEDNYPWIIIGSSFGALMTTVYALENPDKILKLVLLAPFLSILESKFRKFSPIDAPVIVFHGKNDRVVPINRSRTLAERFFTNLIYNIVDDDHSLHNTVINLDWKNIIK